MYCLSIIIQLPLAKCALSAKVHELGPIAMVADRMKQELDAKIKVIADKITGGLNLEKRAWASLQEVEDEVSMMMAEIDKNVQDAVSTYSFEIQEYVSIALAQCLIIILIARILVRNFRLTV